MVGLNEAHQEVGSFTRWDHKQMRRVKQLS
jgi:hypothetical protein